MNDSNDPGAADNPFRAPVDSDFKSGSVGGVSDGAVRALEQTRPWVIVIGVVGFIMAGLILLGAALLVFGSLSGGSFGFTLGLGAVYALMGLIYVPPSLFLIRYAGRIKALRNSRSTSVLEEALVAQKSFWKFAGVFVIVVFVAYAIVMLLTIIS